MTVIQSPVCPSSPAKLDPERGRLVFWLLTIEGALGFDLLSVTWRSKIFGEVGECVYFVHRNVLCVGDPQHMHLPSDF